MYFLGIYPFLFRVPNVRPKIFIIVLFILHFILVFCLICIVCLLSQSYESSSYFAKLFKRPEFYSLSYHFYSLFCWFIPLILCYFLSSVFFLWISIIVLLQIFECLLFFVFCFYFFLLLMLFHLSKSSAFCRSWQVVFYYHLLLCIS